MKINREARQTAKKLFKLSCINGQLDEARVRQTVAAFIAEKPRNYIAILSRLEKLVELEFEKRTVTVLSATDLPDRGASVFTAIEQNFGPALEKNYAVQPSLVAGLRIQRGSDVWDGSIRAKLDTIQKSIR